VPSLSKLKGYIDNLEGINYVLQVKIPEDHANNARKLLDQSDKICASRVLATREKIEKTNIIEKESPIEDPVSVYQKLREFISMKNPKEYSHTKIEDIITSLEETEGTD
jgi:hypothetical protein